MIAGWNPMNVSHYVFEITFPVHWTERDLADMTLRFNDVTPVNKAQTSLLRASMPEQNVRKMNM